MPERSSALRETVPRVVLELSQPMICEQSCGGTSCSVVVPIVDATEGLCFLQTSRASERPITWLKVLETVQEKASVEAGEIRWATARSEVG